MSQKLFEDDVLFLQRFLKSLGLYQGKLDGDWGPKTDAAQSAFVARGDAIAAAEGAVDSRSDGNLRVLHPNLQILGRRMIRMLVGKGVDARVLSGTRSYSQQDALFRQGRFGNAGRIVTKARGGQSNHNFCIAFDIGIFRGGQYLGNENQPYVDAAGLVKANIPGLSWGGDWKSLKDDPHWELPTGLKISDVRTRFEGGTSVVT